jgi:hypothetical protein
LRFARGRRLRQTAETMLAEIITVRAPEGRPGGQSASVPGQPAADQAERAWRLTASASTAHDDASCRGAPARALASRRGTIDQLVGKITVLMASAGQQCTSASPSAGNLIDAALIFSAASSAASAATLVGGRCHRWQPVAAASGDRRLRRSGPDGDAQRGTSQRWPGRRPAAAGGRPRCWRGSPPHAAAASSTSRRPRSARGCASAAAAAWICSEAVLCHGRLAPAAMTRSRCVCLGAWALGDHLRRPPPWRRPRHSRRPAPPAASRKPSPISAPPVSAMASNQR